MPHDSSRSPKGPGRARPAQSKPASKTGSHAPRQSAPSARASGAAPSTGGPRRPAEGSSSRGSSPRSNAPRSSATERTRSAPPARGPRTAPAAGSRDAAAPRKPHRPQDTRPQPQGRSQDPRPQGQGRASDAPHKPQQREKAPAAERYPQAEFAQRKGDLEGFPAVMVVNRALKGYTYRRDFPWCLRLVVAYRADSQNGQPLPKEEATLDAFEQKLFSLLKKTVNGHYVGHTSWGGTREFLFYVDEGGDLEDPLHEFGEAQKRELEFAIEEDEKWAQSAHYFDYRD